MTRRSLCIDTAARRLLAIAAMSTRHAVPHARRRRPAQVIVDAVLTLVIYQAKLLYSAVLHPGSYVTITSRVGVELRRRDAAEAPAGGAVDAMPDAAGELPAAAPIATGAQV